MQTSSTLKSAITIANNKIIESKKQNYEEYEFWRSVIFSLNNEYRRLKIKEKESKEYYEVFYWCKDQPNIDIFHDVNKYGKTFIKCRVNEDFRIFSFSRKDFF